MVSIFRLDPEAAELRLLGGNPRSSASRELRSDERLETDEARDL